MIWSEQLGWVVGTSLRVEKKQVGSSGLTEPYQGVDWPFTTDTLCRIKRALGKI